MDSNRLVTNRSYCSMKSFIRKSLWLACLGAKQGKAIYFVFLCDDDSDFASIMDCKMRRKQTWIKQMFYHLPSQLLALVQKSYYGEILGPNIWLGELPELMGFISHTRMEHRSYRNCIIICKTGSLAR